MPPNIYYLHGGYYRMNSKHQFPKTGLLSRLFSFLSRLLRRDTSENKGTTTQPKETALTSRLVTMLRNEEGVRYKPYKDSLGYWTIGVGHLTDERKGGSLPAYAAAELSDSGRLSDETVNRLLEDDISLALEGLDMALPWAKSLDPVRYCVLVDMCFQMGLNGLLGFKNTLRYIENGNYEQAAINMGKSLWAKQTPNRAKRRIEEMRTGVFHDYQ